MTSPAADIPRAAGEDPVGGRLPGQGFGRKPLRPSLRQVAEDGAADARRGRNLLAAGEDAAMAKMREAAVVVDVHMSKH